MPRGLLIGYTNPVDVRHEEAFNRWYDELHMPEVLATGNFVRGARFRVSRRATFEGLVPVESASSGAFVASVRSTPMTRSTPSLSA
jgi:hypothetical protein